LNTHVKIVISLVVVGAIALVGYKTLLTAKNDQIQLNASDAKNIKAHVRIGVDNWVGYMPLCSGEMKRRMRQAGYLLECVEDQADYSSRMKALKKRSVDFAVATVDSYLLNGAQFDYPGAIVAVIDESKGGDAVVAWKDSVTTIDDLKTNPTLRVGFTPDSPSEHLLKAISSHFDVPHLRQVGGDWRVETEGSTDALEKILKKHTQVAVLWEPDVSKALAQEGIGKILGTEDTHNLIVDVLIVNHDYYRENKAAVTDLLYHYFRTLKHFKDNPGALVSLLAQRDSMKPEVAETVLKGVHWVSLTENALSWFGVDMDGVSSQEGLVESIEATLDILLQAGDFTASPLPGKNPYRLTQREVVSSLFSTGNTIGFGTNNNKGSNDGSTDSLTRPFSILSENGWLNLREVGTLRNRPLTFQSGTSTLDDESKKELDKAAKQLSHYPNFRLLVGGHTGLRGDTLANKMLSQSRAESVATYFSQTYGVNVARLRPVGYGADHPLPKIPGESNRSHNYRLPRVELSLVAEEL